jgi:hypothetical protein
MPHPKKIRKEKRKKEKKRKRKRRCLSQIPMVQQYKIVGSHIYTILS